MTTTMTAPAGRQRIYLTSGIYDTAADGTIAIPDTEIAACMSCGYTLVTSSSTSGVTYKGAVACAADPNYPAAVVGDQYKVSSAGHIGGASGPVVEIGDVLECITATVAGDHATVGTKWLIGQTNIEKPVRGPASTVTSGALCLFDGTTGDLVKQATALPTGTSIATLNCTTLDTNVTAAGVTLTGVTLAADGTDAAIDIAITPKGATGKVNMVGAASSTGLLAVTSTAAVTAPGSVRGVVSAMTTTAGAVTSGTLAAIRGIVTYLTQTLTNVFTYGVQGKLVGAGATIDAGSSHVCGVLAQMDLSGTTVSSGHIAPLIVSGQTLPASAYVNMVYFESGGNKINAAEQFNVAANFLWDINNFESCGIITTPSGATHSGNLRTIKVQIDGATYYILAAAVISA